MAANGGGGPPFLIKNEGGFNIDDDESKSILELDDDDDHDHGHNNNIDDDDDDHGHHHVGNISNNMKGISIAERRAAKCGFNAVNINNAAARCTAGLSSSPHLQSPYVTIPPGISPSVLLDSPILLPNAQAQLSPTTGTFKKFPLSPNPESLKLKLKLASKEEEEGEEEEEEPEYSHSGYHDQQQPIFEDYFEYPPRDFQEMSKNIDDEYCVQDHDHDQCLISLQPTIDARNHHNQKGSSTTTGTAGNIPKEVAPPPANIYYKHNPSSSSSSSSSEDRFYWRKYGQKHVKGSEFPRSYYKCTNANCLVKKKVERSHAGDITQIVYKGSHNHPIPAAAFNKRFMNNNNIDIIMPADMATHDHHDADGAKAVGSDINNHNCKNMLLPADYNNIGATSSAASLNNILSSSSDHHFSDQHPPPPPLPVDHQTQEFSSNNIINIRSSQDGEDQNPACSPAESISFKDEDDDESNGSDQCEPKKRKRESLLFPNETCTTIPRSARESKVVVQIESDVDILDDGYRWRKYGQKVVKGNPNPRSYYKCTTPGCPVRKHVERAADDIKSVLTTYEGKHNHNVPTSNKTAGSLAIISDIAAATANPPAAVANNNNNNNTTINPNPISPLIMAQQHDHHHVSKAGGKQSQDLPLYMERKPPILNYNIDFIMRPNMPAGGPDHLIGCGTTPSCLYPYSFPPFPSLSYDPLLMNGVINNHMKTTSTYSVPTSSSKFLYPMLPPEYMSLPSQIRYVPAAATHVPNNNIGSSNFSFNNYAAFQNSTRGQEQMMTRQECQNAKMMMMKHQTDDDHDHDHDDEGELYDTCMSIPNHHGN